VRTGTTWTQQAYLKASYVREGGYFGSSVAVNGTIVVGQHIANSAEVFGSVISTTGTTGTTGSTGTTTQIATTGIATTGYSGTGTTGSSSL
jgi:hypothetical protein